MNGAKPTSPLLAAFITFLLALLASTFVAVIFFGTFPDIDVVPLEYAVPLMLAVMTYFSHRRAYNRWRTLAASSSGMCPKCNYNLTGNTSGVCPECGTDVASKATTGTDSV